MPRGGGRESRIIRGRMRLFSLIVLLALLPAPSVAVADEADTELARRRFETGKLLYDRGRYDQALVELQSAQASLQRPELDYNIGLCLDKLGRAREAADALERYIQARPDDGEAAGIWQLIAELRARAVA